jgi:hypothetical protein
MRSFIALCVVLFACACGNSGGTVEFSASGEVLALGGYSFPPASPTDSTFVDGWAVSFTKFIATIDKIKLSQNPDSSPTDQSVTGKLVAEVDGPWAIDLHKGGPLMGKGGAGEEALPITTLDKQNLNGGAAFDPSVRYAFGFDLVPASAAATRLNIDADDADYQDMIENGYVVLYIGTATWMGTSSCTTTNSAFDFSQMPTTVSFRLGFKSPTTYINCQNPDNDPALPIGGEEHERGVQIASTGTTIAQVTVHTDHPFWESTVHDSPAHFDPLAAVAKVVNGAASVTMDDTVGVDYTAFTYNGQLLPWRACAPGYSPPNTNPQMGFDSQGIPHDPIGDPGTTLRDYHDYMTYNQSTQGHLNSDGLCFVSRNYPSPP